MNRYDVVHVTTRHPKMTDAELLDIYHRAWDLYYSPEHVETVLRRAKSWGYDTHNMMWKLLSFHGPPVLEHVHPLEGGIFRRKYRRDRRPGMPRENPFTFYARYGWEMLVKHVRFARLYWQYRTTLKRVQGDPRPYMDTAMTPVQASDVDALELFKTTGGARAAADKQRRRQAVVAEHAAEHAAQHAAEHAVEHAVEH